MVGRRSSLLFYPILQLSCCVTDCVVMSLEMDRLGPCSSLFYSILFVGSCLCNGTPLPSQGDSYHLSSLIIYYLFLSSLVAYIFWLFMHHPFLCGSLFLMFSHFSFHIFIFTFSPFTLSLDSIHLAAVSSHCFLFHLPYFFYFILIIKPMCISYFFFFFMPLSFPSSLSSPSSFLFSPLTITIVNYNCSKIEISVTSWYSRGHRKNKVILK